MKLLAVADVHGRYSAVTEILKRVAPVDALVVAGDVSTCGTPLEVAQAVRSWMLLAPRVFAVAGNMDSPAIDRELETLGVSLDGRCQRLGEVAFFGCSAAPLSIGTPYEIPESEILARSERGFGQAGGASIRVYVPHAPPRGCLDRTWSGAHAGSRSVAAVVEQTQPHLVVCGHIHEARGQAVLGSSRVVNCGPAARGRYALIELDDAVCRATLF